MSLGAAKTRVTPPRGTWMAGYRARRAGAAFEHDELYARCLALEDRGERFAVVSLDVMAVGVEWVTELRRRARAELGLPAEHLLVSATHTHAAQGGLCAFDGEIGRALGVMMGDGCGSYDGAGAEFLLRQTLSTLTQAFERLTPGTLSWAHGRAPGVAANRIDPQRPADDSCLAVTALDADGGVIAVMFHFNCHPTTLGEDDLGISGDFPGEAARIAEAALGGVALHLNGALGDVSTRYTRRDQSYGEVRRFGRLLGGEVVRLAGAARPFSDVRLRAAEQVIELTPRDARRLERIEQRVEALASGADSGHGTARQLLTALEGVESAVRSQSVISELDSVPVAIQTLSFGPELAFCAVPGELFSAAGAAIEAARGRQTVKVVGPANGYLGYLPTVEAFDDGGYEAGCSLIDRGGAEEIARHAVTLLGTAEQELGGTRC